jgi:thiamine biosynthesis protein ThiS
VSVTILLNGEKRELPSPASVQTAADHLGLSGRHLVAELNMEILSRETWGERILSEGDQLEFIGFVGGGAGQVLHVPEIKTILSIRRSL